MNHACPHRPPRERPARQRATVSAASRTLIPRPSPRRPGEPLRVAARRASRARAGDSRGHEAAAAFAAAMAPGARALGRPAPTRPPAAVGRCVVAARGSRSRGHTACSPQPGPHGTKGPTAVPAKPISSASAAISTGFLGVHPAVNRVGCRRGRRYCVSVSRSAARLVQVAHLTR